MQINRLGLAVLVALLSWWAQGYTMTVQVEGASASQDQASKEMEVPVAMVHERKDTSAPIPVQDELSFSNTAQIQESNDMGAPIPIQDELSFSNDGPIQEINDKGAHIPVQNELSISDVTPIQESKDKGTPLPVQDERSLLDFTPVEENKYKVAPATIQTPRRMGSHARDQKHPHHQGKGNLPPNAPAPAPAPTLPGNDSTNATQRKYQKKEMAIKVVKICGNILTTSPLPLPFVVYWTTGHLESTRRFYSKLSVGSTALSTYAWLTYSILQVSYKDKEQFIGLEAIVVNSISWGCLAFMLMFLVMHEGVTRGKRCIVGLVIHALLTLVLIQFPILRLVKSGSHGKLTVGVIASLLQALSEIVPLFSLWKIWSVIYPPLGHQDGPAIPNYKKMTIVARAVDFFVTLYWMQFCISTYEFDEFGIANIVSAGLSLFSFVAHLAWALKPNQ